ncbi:hypothetical protein HMPREF0063_10206 [Aeromicrobium marinum DSM 15272]|uniref:Uncharacterized protein n=1 Tax=Aeromicrobium marinum DSM 15272 TaxID=585531 RepID=E2S849_9ACTN|nr:hypothetical protein [Aeromicrobium marinum]EFQ84354.1 hypothetical protein HMPREF0063_10206 [Aeromicrobium marinum DSM 15272]
MTTPPLPNTFQANEVPSPFGSVPTVWPAPTPAADADADTGWFEQSIASEAIRADPDQRDDNGSSERLLMVPCLEPSTVHLTPTQRAIAKELWKWGPVTDESLAGLRSWQTGGTVSRGSLRNHLLVLQQAGAVASAQLHGGRRVRWLTAHGAQLVGLPHAPAREITADLIAFHELLIGALVGQVLPSITPGVLVSGTEILTNHRVDAPAPTPAMTPALPRLPTRTKPTAAPLPSGPGRWATVLSPSEQHPEVGHQRILPTFVVERPDLDAGSQAWADAYFVWTDPDPVVALAAVFDHLADTYLFSRTTVIAPPGEASTRVAQAADRHHGRVSVLTFPAP